MTLNNESQESDKYFKYLFNKVEFDKLKVHSNFYRKNINKINSFIINKKNSNSKSNLKTKKILKEKEEINQKITKIYPFNSYNSPKTNKKLDEIQDSPIESKKIIFNKKLSQIRKNKKLKTLNKPTKIQQKYLKILKGVLDNELYDEKIGNKTNEKVKTLIQRNRNNLNKKSQENNKEKNNINFIDSIQIGKYIINNCILRNKIIYDIKPLNKSEQKGKCFFHYEDNNNINSNITDRNTIINSINNNSICETNIINKEKTQKKEKDKNINKLLNNIQDSKINKIKKICEIPLNSLLSKDISPNLKSLNLKTFYGRGSGDMMRGEKIKFIKTCYPVKFIKPLLTQKGYILKSHNLSSLSKEINQYKNKNNIYNNIVLRKFKRKNDIKIKSVKDELKIIKRNIFNAFKWFDEQKEHLFKFETEYN